MERSKHYMKLFLANFSYILILELIFKLMVMKTYDIGILYISIFAMLSAIIMTFIMSLFSKNIINKVISFILWIILYFIFAAETVYYSFYKTICGLSALMYGGQVMDFASAILAHIKANSVVLIVMFIPLIVMFYLSLSKKIKHCKFSIYETSVLFLSILFMVLTSLELVIPNQETAKNLFFNTNDIMQSTNEFGVINAVSLDAIKTLSGFEENIVITSKRPFTKEEGKEYNITNIDFDSLIKNTKNNTLKSMHSYFKNEEPTEKNKYTGIFAGKNLIFITAEGFYPIAVDKDVTPTLYKLVNNGFVFNNYYQPIYNCSTSDGEFINSLSILPGVSTCSMKATQDAYLPYSLGKIMKTYDYKTYAFHGWTYTYYNRDKTMPNLGYTYYGYDRYKKHYKYALKGIKDSWPTSDVDVINSSYNIFNKDENFMAYYMSISGHLEYNFTGGNAMSIRNRDSVKNMNASENIKAYIASQVEFDKSLKILLDNLEKDGILDDTVIVISADHYPYGLTNKDIADYVDWMKNPNFDLYKNNLVIYNSEINENVYVDKYTSSLDLLPTVLNLFGVKYDSRLLVGKDIFSDSEDLVIFNNKSWITDKGRYDYPKKKFESFDGTEVDDKYINEINEIVKLKFQMSKLLISKNYYKYVIGGNN